MLIITTNLSVTIRIQKTEPQSHHWSQNRNNQGKDVILARLKVNLKVALQVQIAYVALQEQDRSFEKLTDKFDYFFKVHVLCFTNNLIWPKMSKR
jgi:hypothetical protein